MIIKFVHGTFVIVGGTGLIVLAAFLTLLFATVGQEFWLGIRLANDAMHERSLRHFIMSRMHLLTWVFYASFACIVAAKFMQHFLTQSE